jgi:predicted transcriptional regulator
MQVKEVMSRNPDYLTADATIREAAQHMRDRETGFIPVAQNDKIIGTITDRDLTMRVLAEGRGLDERVSSVITDKVLYCYEDSDIKDVLKNMREEHVQRLIVLNNDRDKDLAGIISLSDIADKCADQDGEICRLVCQATQHYH